MAQKQKSLFSKQKLDFLSKKDKSKKGSIDKKMIPIVGLINKEENYYTTSCCAGRIVLLHQTSGRKNETNWLFSSHAQIKSSQLKNALLKSKLPKKGMVWLLAEAPIIHIACKTEVDAWKLVEKFKQGGFKRTSLISSTPNKTTIEAFGNQRIEMPVAKNGKLIVPISSLSNIALHANTKLKRSHEALQKLESRL